MTGAGHGGAAAAGTWPAAARLLAAAPAGPSPLWYATRATGVIALVLLTATVVLGVIGTARVSSPRWPRLVTAGLHRSLSLLVVGFVAAHVLTTVLDSYAPIGWVAAVVPFASPYRPVWLGLGAVASDLLLALMLTSLLRARLGYRGWRAVHWLAYACWPIALWHGLGTGTDSRLGWLLALDAACLAAVGCAVAWRVSFSDPQVSRVAVLAGTAGLALVTVIFVLVGPLQHGWARRAGTPAYLLGAQALASPGPGSTAPGSSPLGGSALRATGLPGSASFSGRASRTRGPAAGELTISVAAQVTGSPRRALQITLHGYPDDDGISLTSGSVRIGPAAGRPGYQGPVVTLRGQVLTATLRAQSVQPGPAVRARMTLFLRGGTAHGRLTLQTAGPA